MSHAYYICTASQQCFEARATLTHSLTHWCACAYHRRGDPPSAGRLHHGSSSSSVSLCCVALFVRSADRAALGALASRVRARRKEKDLLHHLWILYYSSFASLVQTSLHVVLCVVYLYFNQEVCYWVTCNGKISFLFFLYRARSEHNTIAMDFCIVRTPVEESTDAELCLDCVVCRTECMMASPCIGLSALAV